jgi:hypothetical protein
MALDKLFDTLNSFLAPEDPKKKAERIERKSIISKQREIERWEINQTWKVVFGTIKPKNKKDILKFIDITYRNLWMEENFLFNQAIALNPGKRFHDISQYALQWQPPGSVFRVMIPLGDPSAQVNAVNILKSLTPAKRNKMLFYFTTINPNMELFAPPLNPAADVSYHSRSQVLKKLCDIYLAGALSLHDLHTILEESYSVWKRALYNMLPEDEQQYHHYLTKEPPKEIKKSLERKYLDDDINIETYIDMKFPIRKMKRDEENLTYPRPFEYETCLICSSDLGCIKCMHCVNKVCISCIQRVFCDQKTAEGSFLLLHRRYCTKFGRLPYIDMSAAACPGYLLELQSTGKGSVDKFYVDRRNALLRSEDELKEVDSSADIVENEEEEKPESDDDENAEEEELAKSIGAEAAFMRKRLIHTLTKCLHKYNHLLPQLKEYQHIIDNPNRSSHLIARMIRIKEEKLLRVNKNNEKVDKVIFLLQKYDKNTETVKLLISTTLHQKAVMKRFLESKSLAEFEENEEKMQADLEREKKEQVQKNAKLLVNQYL